MYPDDAHADIYSVAFCRASRSFQGLVAVLVVINLLLMFAPHTWEFTSAMLAFAAFTVAIFTIEYTAKFWACCEGSRRRPWLARFHFIVTPSNLLDLVALVLMWLFVIERSLQEAGGASALRLPQTTVLRLARMARLARVAKSASHVSSWSTTASEEKTPLDSERFYTLSNEQLQALDGLVVAIESRSVASFEESMQSCKTLAIPEQDIDAIRLQKRLESENAGISLAYLLSSEFEALAKEATGKEDPTFSEMQDPFFLTGAKDFGKGWLCPRDLRPGCAFIDTLAPNHRKRANTFLSWVWRYKLSVVRSGLERWAERSRENPADVFLFMCFFCNNQWRILVEQSADGSDNLEDVFENRLTNAGRMVALMDSWHSPLYITRIWTIFEQYEAMRKGINVQFTLPEEPAATLLEQLGKGTEGIMLVVREVSKVNAQNAKATMKEDEIKVKALITNTIGFLEVNKCVKRTITQWVASEFKDLIDELVAKVEEHEDEFTKDSFQAKAILDQRSLRRKRLAESAIDSPHLHSSHKATSLHSCQNI